MFDMTSLMCMKCAVTNCADCSEAVGTCKTCADGFKLDANGDCVINEDDLPCASGYSKAAGKCEACPAGCTSCDGT